MSLLLAFASFTRGACSASARIVHSRPQLTGSMRFFLDHDNHDIRSAEFDVTGLRGATGRIVDTLVGSAAGLVGGMVFARLHTEPARQAVGDLAGRLGDLLTDMADGLEYIPG